MIHETPGCDWCHREGEDMVLGLRSGLGKVYQPEEKLFEQSVMESEGGTLYKKCRYSVQWTGIEFQGLFRGTDASSCSGQPVARAT